MHMEHAVRCVGCAAALQHATACTVASHVQVLLYDMAAVLGVGWQRLAMWEDSTAQEVRTRAPGL